MYTASEGRRRDNIYIIASKGNKDIIRIIVTSIATDTHEKLLR